MSDIVEFLRASTPTTRISSRSGGMMHEDPGDGWHRPGAWERSDRHPDYRQEWA